MLRTIVVDDEQPAIDMMIRLLEQSGSVEVAGAFRKPKDAIARIAELKPDVAFLDVQMPLMNGMELAERLVELHEDLEIVFTTAFDHYAVEAFRLNAIDYLLKPVTPEQLSRTIARLLKRKGLLAKPPGPAPGARLVCFGGFRLLAPGGGEASIRWRTAKSEELLAFLYMHSAKETPKWEIMEQLWPGCTSEQAHSHLHTTMYKMKKTLKDAGIEAKIQFNKGGYRLEWIDVTSDMKEFELFARQAPPLSEATLALYDRQLRLYGGDLFGDRGYPWCMREREEYRHEYEQLSKKLCRYWMALGRYEAAAGRVRALLEHSALDEEAHELLLQIYDLQNDRIGLIQHYHKMASLFDAELGIKPGAGATGLYEKRRTR